MTSTYVNVSRSDLEDWLDGLVRGNALYKGWSAVPGTSGVYLLHLSQFVSIKVSSTLTSRDSAKGKGKASTKLSLVSRLFPRIVLNKKSNKQKSFYRTTNWRATWAKGIAYLADHSYLDKSDFYDNIARIEDRSAYQADKIKAIESINGWASKAYLVKYHQSLTKGFILWPNQEKIIEDILSKQPLRNTQVPSVQSPATTTQIIPVYDVDQLRRLYVEMRNYKRRKSEEMTFGDVPVSTVTNYLDQLDEELAWVAEFGKKQVAGQRPSAEEKRKVDAFLRTYKVR